MTVTMTLGQLAEALGATLQGLEALQITGLATLQEAGTGQLSFLANPKYRKYLDNNQAAAVLLKAADAEGYAGNALIVPDPYLAYARISTCSIPSPRLRRVFIPAPWLPGMPRWTPVPASDRSWSSRAVRGWLPTSASVRIA